jgi:MFS family permease
MAIDETTAIRGRSKVGGVGMLQAALFLGFMLASAQYSAFPASYKILEEQRGFSAEHLAVIASFEKIAHCVSVVFWGMYVDQFPKFSILSCTALAWALTTVPLAFATTYSQLLTLRMLSGLLGGCLTPLSAVIVASSVPRQDRGKAFGFLLFFENIGNIVGQTMMIEFQHTAGAFGLQGWQFCYIGLAFFICRLRDADGWLCHV